MTTVVLSPAPPRWHEMHRRLDFALVRAMRPLGLLYPDGFGRNFDERVRAVREFAHVPRHVTLRWKPVVGRWGGRVRVGTFASPAAAYLPQESQLAVVEQWLPEPSTRPPPVCLILTSTGEEGMLRRRPLARFLAQHGISALLLENPYYGARRPRGQRGTALRTVADQLAMSLATVEEACGLLRTFHDDGHDLGVTGYSQGGVMAAFAASISRLPMAVIPRGAPAATAPVLIEHAMSHGVHWEVLAQEAGSLEAAHGRVRDALDGVRLDLHPAPVEPRRAIVVGHLSDAFIPPAEIERLHRHWRGSELRWLDGGHVTGLANFRDHRKAILDALSR